MREAYFQSVTRIVLRLRGTPFMLSPKEMVLIDDWYARRIPLRVVRDALRAAYEEFRLKPRSGKRGMPLTYAHLRVLRAFAQYRDRRIGGRRPAVPSRNQRARALLEVEGFLAAVPGVLDFIRPEFERARMDLKGTHLDEAGLERREEKIEKMLLDGVPDELKAEAQRRVSRDFDPETREERKRLTELMLLKLLRERFRIPWVSLFYY